MKNYRITSRIFYKTFDFYIAEVTTILKIYAFCSNFENILERI